MFEEEVCGTCRYHRCVDGEWVCMHNEADAYGLETDYKDGDDCEYWKGGE